MLSFYGLRCFAKITAFKKVVLKTSFLVTKRKDTTRSHPEHGRKDFHRSPLSRRVVAPLKDRSLSNPIFIKKLSAKWLRAFCLLFVLLGKYELSPLKRNRSVGKFSNIIKKKEER